MSEQTQYWLCCGSLDFEKHSSGCIEAKRSFPQHCRYGTLKEHSDWQLEKAEKNRDKITPIPSEAA